MRKKNVKLRIAWIIPNVLMYVGLVVFTMFVITNITELYTINRLGIWVIALIVLLFVALYGSYRIALWIRHGNM